MASIPTRRVFISSTTADLAQYRQEAVRVIHDLNAEYKGRFQLVEVTMDTEGQTGERETAVNVSTQWVNTSDWVVLIVGWHYGYVAPDETYSVTELEYRQSQEVCQPPKSCFVYLAGERDDGEPYRALSQAREKLDLARWKEQDQVPEEHREKLKKFKTNLRSKRFQLFSNLDQFLTLLTESLKKRIERELHPYDDGILPRMSLLLGLEEPMQRCIEEVKLLATLKRIHDRLHNIRQFGIRRWREEVLTQWQEGLLSGEAKATFFQGLARVNEYRWRLDGFLLQLPDEAEMPTVIPKNQIQRVLDTRFGEESETEGLSNQRAFESATDLFASRVQSAFTTTNLAMLERAGVLRRYYEKLLTSLNKARGLALAPEDEAQLNQELEALQERHEGLQSVLGRHNKWQQMHDQLERLDSSKGSSCFVGDLDRFLDNREAMDILTKDAVQLAHASGKAELWQEKIDALKRHLKAVVAELAENRDELSYEGMRKAFDDLFYNVDVETLSSVEASERRASEFDRRLKELLSQGQARPSDARAVPAD